MTDKASVGSAATSSANVTLNISTLDEGYERTITAYASFPSGDGLAEATVVKSFDLYKAEQLKGVSVEDATEALKREALRELVTQLNLHGVL